MGGKVRDRQAIDLAGICTHECVDRTRDREKAVADVCDTVCVFSPHRHTGRGCILTLEIDDAHDSKAITRRMLLLSIRIEMGTS